MLKTFIVNSDSMFPSIRKGDLVEIIEIESVSEIKKGDVAVFEVEERFYAHRILYKGEFFFLSAGDNNTITDSPLPVSILKGKIKLERNFRSSFPVASFLFYAFIRRLNKIL